MKSKEIAVLALLGCGLTGCAVYVPPPPPPPDEVRVDASDHGAVEIGVFYDELTPYGRWVERPGYGRVWLPAQVAAGWRPYSLGRWVQSDYGWTWVSEEPFGWATYHYGRWDEDAELGWIWVPGREWGPAWVAWQSGGGYIGWAPLPPAVGFRAGIGLDFGRVVIAPRAYAFVEERAFLAPRVAIVPVERNVTIIHNTTNVTNYTVINNRIVNRSIDERHVEQVTGQKVHHYQITDAPAGDRQRSGRVQGDQIGLYCPAAQNRQGRRATDAQQPAAQQPATRRRQTETHQPETAAEPSRRRHEDAPATTEQHPQHTRQQADRHPPKPADAQAKGKANPKPKEQPKKPDKKKDHKKEEKKD